MFKGFLQVGASLLLCILTLLSVNSVQAQEGESSNKINDTVSAGTTSIPLSERIVTEARNSTTLLNSPQGFFLLQVAYENDQQLQKLDKNHRFMHCATSTGELGGLTMDLMHHITDSTAAGVIGAGSGLAIWVISTGLNHVYNKRIHNRQIAIRSQLETILARLDNGEPSRSISAHLETLVGADTARAFLQLWESSPRLVVASKH